MLMLAVFSCNRMFYLRNCVESILEFMHGPLHAGEAELLVVDNASSEPGMDEYLASLPTWVTIHRFGDRSPSELYRAMNFAVRLARERGREFVHFIQDDCQFLRADPTLMARIRDLFGARPEIAQLHVNLAWRDKFAKWQREGRVSDVSVGGERCLLLQDKPPCDTGVTRVSLFDRIGEFPGDVSLKGDAGIIGEEWLYAQCRRVGALRAQTLRPVMGMLYDAAYVRGQERIGVYRPPPNRYYIKPLAPEAIARIEERAQGGLCSFIEEFQEPDGWVPRSMQVRSELGRVAIPDARRVG